jgi:hypothetical protein
MWQKGCIDVWKEKRNSFKIIKATDQWQSLLNTILEFT